MLELSKCSAFSKHQGSALARRFHMVAWTMYEEDVDSERMHLDTVATDSAQSHLY